MSSLHIVLAIFLVSLFPRSSACSMMWSCIIHVYHTSVRLVSPFTNMTCPSHAIMIISRGKSLGTLLFGFKLRLRFGGSMISGADRFILALEHVQNFLFSRPEWCSLIGYQKGPSGSIEKYIWFAGWLGREWVSTNGSEIYIGFSSHNFFHTCASFLCSQCGISTCCLIIVVPGPEVGTRYRISRTILYVECTQGSNQRLSLEINRVRRVSHTFSPKVIFVPSSRIFPCIPRRISDACLTYL